MLNVSDSLARFAALGLFKYVYGDGCGVGKSSIPPATLDPGLVFQDPAGFVAHVGLLRLNVGIKYTNCKDNNVYLVAN